jgi:hypothetical protein
MKNKALIVVLMLLLCSTSIFATRISINSKRTEQYATNGRLLSSWNIRTTIVIENGYCRISGGLPLLFSSTIYQVLDIEDGFDGDVGNIVTIELQGFGYSRLTLSIIPSLRVVAVYHSASSLLMISYYLLHY